MIMTETYGVRARQQAGWRGRNNCAVGAGEQRIARGKRLRCMASKHSPRRHGMDGAPGHVETTAYHALRQIASRVWSSLVQVLPQMRVNSRWVEQRVQIRRRHDVCEAGVGGRRAANRGLNGHFEFKPSKQEPEAKGGQVETPENTWPKPP
jgi:hypothetical protein